MNPLLAIVVISLVSAFLFLCFVFIGSLTDWKVTNPQRFRRVYGIAIFMQAILSSIEWQIRLKHPSTHDELKERYHVSLANNDVNWINEILPDYPYQAKAEHLTGNVIGDATVSAGGHVSRVEIVSGPPPLVQSAQPTIHG